MTKLLAICIPTYNGGEYFKYNVNKLIDMSLKYNFDICVSDNASTDDTEEYMLKLIAKYDFIKYHRNGKNMGVAYNFDYVLKMADTKYAWLLGDDDEILENGLVKVIEILTKYKPDICVVNGYSGRKRVENIKSKLYGDKNDVLSDIGEHMSWISTLIFSKVVNNKINIKDIKDNAFPHLIEIFRYINGICKVYWIDIICVKTQKNAVCRYSSRLLDYFVKDWYRITKEIGNYNNKSKQDFIKNGFNRCFSLRAILGSRALNVLNKNSLSKIEYELKFFPKKAYIFLYFASKIPSNLLLFIKNIKRLVVNRRNNK